MQTLWYDHCRVVDPDCESCGILSDKLETKLYYGSTVKTIDAAPINLSGFAKGEKRMYYDTVHIYQTQFPVTNIQSNLTQYEVLYTSDFGENGEFFDINCHPYPDPQSVIPVGEFFDHTLTNHTYRYRVVTRIRVIPNLEPSYTLPSHDKVLLEQTATLSYTPLWQYQDTLMAETNTWNDIPSTFTRKNGNILDISGVDIFGSNYINFLHSTVKFRVVNPQGQPSGNPKGTYFSEAVPFTLRLSSPHITSVTATDLNCFERHEGTVKVQFDRALLPGERLSILMYDTVHKTNYSALNMSELAPDNSYTWANELRAGTYMLTLLGKYAKGLEYDLDVATRVPSIPTYVALNTVDFEDGFESDDPDDFNSYTDYTGYSQATYTGSLTHLSFVGLDQPGLIDFGVKVDSMVKCKGMATGEILLGADSGKYNFKYSLKRVEDAEWGPWVNFDNNNKGHLSLPGFSSLSAVKVKIKNLLAGKYLIRVRDEVDCYPKDANGNEVTKTFTITEPEKGISIDLLEVTPITHPDLSNGKVKVHISGGSPFLNGEVFQYPYRLTWTDSATNLPEDFTQTILEQNKRMELVSENLSDGAYYLRVYDAYYWQVAPNNAGCFLEMKIPVRKPQPLVVYIESRKQINCADSANAELMAMPSGGIMIEDVRYTFKWYDVTGGGNDLLEVTDSLITDLGPGDYRVEVTDKYNNTAMSPVFTVTEPTPLQLQMGSTQSSCYTTGDGTLSVLVTGGTPYENGYKYEWSTGDRTPTVDSVAGGNYLVIVTDSMFCMVMDTISVTSPVRLIPDVTVQQVTCRGACDGQISVITTGGSGSYTYEWSNGATTSTVSNLCPGLYWFKVRDVNGCMDSIAVELDNPDTLAVNLGQDRKICIGQTIRLDATASDTAVLTYSWTATNGFTASTAKVAITQAGTYYVAVSNMRGCVVRDTIVIAAENSTINTDFVMSTQAFAGDPVTLVNISQPTTDSVHWILPLVGNNIEILQQNNQRCELKFSDTGRYAITMRAFYPSGCIEDSVKYINVVPKSGPITTGNQGNAFLKAYAVIYPNPSTGTFKVDLEFSEITKARLRLINTLTNIIVDDRQIQGDDEYLLDYNMNPLANGVYILVIEAAKGSFVYKVIIAH